MEQFRQAIELLEDSNFYYVITTDMSGNYRYINSRYAKAFSFITNSFVGKPYHITMHIDDMKVCEEVGAKCFCNPDKFFPATIRKHDGKGGYIITQWEYRAMFEDGVPVGIFCLGYDITKFIDDQQQLKLAESENEKRAKALREIAFQHSHLIRSPLSNILGLAVILDKMDAGANVKNICSMILESAEKLDLVVRDVVDKTHK